jgi:N-methylhydantoinase A/oxoprolinase/acetone carboxylase beta subunit
MIPGLGLLKSVGTILTVASTAQFGSELYTKYKGKKKTRQLEEVHEFIGSLDLEALQEAVDSKNEDALINAVNDIMMAAEAVKVKSDLEELGDDAQEVATKIFGHVSNIASKVASKVNEKLDEVKEAVDEMEDEDLETVPNPTYKAFKKQKAILSAYCEANTTEYNITVDDPNVSTNNKRKTVTFITPDGHVSVTQLS